ncbi:MAG: hypothetical protein ABSD44_16905 [Terracidiphilus sp.]
MRNYVFALVFLACSLTLVAQSTPKIEIFGGFSYLNYEAASVNLPSGTETIVDACSDTICSASTSTVTAPSYVKFNPRMGLYGWNGSVTAILTPWFGFTTDVSGNYSTSTSSATTTETTIETPACLPSPCSPSTLTSTSTYQYTVSEPLLHHFLFGPQFSFPTGKMRTYAHFLIGGDHKSVSISEIIAGTAPDVVSVLNPATTTSTNVFAMGFGGGADYPLRKKLWWRTGADYLTSTGTAQNHFRVSTGLVWRIGK